MFTFYIYVSARVLCVYILIACSSKNLCGIAKLDVGYVTVCSAKRMKEFSRVSWLDLGGQGRYNMISELQFSTVILDGPSKSSEAKFHRGFILKWPNFKFQSVHGKT
jgi:hypothetical protein